MNRRHLPLYLSDKGSKSTVVNRFTTVNERTLEITTLCLKTGFSGKTVKTLIWSVIDIECETELTPPELRIKIYVEVLVYQATYPGLLETFVELILMASKVCPGIHKL